MVIGIGVCSLFVFFFFNDTATTEIYTLSLHDALPIFDQGGLACAVRSDNAQDLARPDAERDAVDGDDAAEPHRDVVHHELGPEDRKSTRLNSSHANISYAVFCLKKKKNNYITVYQPL